MDRALRGSRPVKELLDWLFGSWRTVGFVAISTVLIYLSVVVALRVGERRTLAEMSTFDFAVAVAIGSIIGRVSTARSPTYVQGLAALVTLLVAHYLITLGRARSSRIKRWVERAPRIVLRDGEILHAELRREHLTEADLMRKLREHNVHDLDEVELVVLEARGGFSILRRGPRPLDARVAAGLDFADRRPTGVHRPRHNPIRLWSEGGTMGSFEETKGKLKEAAGDLTQDPELEREGSAQQDKAEAQQDAEQARREASSAESSARQSEREQEAAQQAK